MLKEFYEKRSKNEKLLVLAAFLTIVILFMDWFVLGPIMAQMKLLDAEIEAKSQTIRRNFRILSYRDSIMGEFSKYDTYFDSGDKSQEVIIADLLKEIESIAAKKSITISNIKPGDVVETPVFHEYKTSLECSGKISDLLGFMNSLEESDFLFQILNFTLAPKAKGSDILKGTIDVSRVFIALDKIMGDQTREAVSKRA